MTTPAAIAATLTEAQRRAIHNARDGQLIYASPATRCALQRKGLVVDRMYSEQLTPLGLAVRAHLENPHGR